MRQFYEGLFVLLFIALVAFSLSLAYLVGDIFSLSSTLFIPLSLGIILVLPSSIMFALYKLFRTYRLDLTDKSTPFKKKVMDSVILSLIVLAIVFSSSLMFIYYVIL